MPYPTQEKCKKFQFSMIINKNSEFVLKGIFPPPLGEVTINKSLYKIFVNMASYVIISTVLMYAINSVYFCII